MPPARRTNEHRHETGLGPSELRAKGRRLTRQRQLIWNVLAAEPDQHLSAEDVVDRVRLDLPRVNPSTVYRTLELLVAEGLLVRTDLGAGRAFFEPARDHPHHHLVCSNCGSVEHVHDADLGNLRQHIRKRAGFLVDQSEITLIGLCRDCWAR